MRQALFATLLASLVLAATPVLAADLPRRSPPPQDYYSPRPVANWEGFYAGINGGIGFGAFTDGADTLFANPTGGLIGFTAGYNHMVATQPSDWSRKRFRFRGPERVAESISRLRHPGQHQRHGDGPRARRLRHGPRARLCHRRLRRQQQHRQREQCVGRRILWAAVDLPDGLGARRGRRIHADQQSLGQGRIFIHFGGVQTATSTIRTTRYSPR